MQSLMTTEPPVRDVAVYPPAPAPRPAAPTVESALLEILERGARIGSGLGEGYQQLWAALAAASQGGKRRRPGLLDAGYRAWGGTDTRAVCVLGAAVELLHTAFVIHDDVVDGDERRRGRLNVSGSHARLARDWGAATGPARGYGDAAGILAG